MLWSTISGLNRPSCTGDEDEGVVVKQRRDKFVCCPPDLQRPGGFFEAVQALNVKVRTYRVAEEAHAD
jgi:hypothetical protein